MRHLFSLLYHRRFRELFLAPSDNGMIQFFRFLFVGGAATCIDIGTGWLFFRFAAPESLMWFGVTLNRDIISAAVGFLFGLIANYTLSVLWIFRKPTVSRLLEFLSFFAIGLIGLLVKSGSIALIGLVLPGQTDLIFLLKSAMGTLTALIWNFTARKVLLYTDHSRKEKQG